MGVKEAGTKQRIVPTGDQIRLAKVTAEPLDEDQEQMKRLIKKVTETTLCTKAQAEIALFDNDNNVDLAVLQILDNPDLDWTEQKNKKDKKKEEPPKYAPRGSQTSSRGRKEWVERPAANRGDRGPRPIQGTTTNGGTTQSRGPSRGAAQNGRGRGGRQQTNGRPEYSKASNNQEQDENFDWQNGPLVFKRTDESASAETQPAATTPVVNGATNAAGPISFAAAAAASLNKEKQRIEQQQKLHQQQRVVETKPSPSVEDTPPVTESVASPSVHAADESAEPEVEEDIEVQVQQEPISVPQNSAAEWTNKLKSELGIGVTLPEPSFPTGPSAKAVEFVSDAAPSYGSTLSEYQFGFSADPVELPPAHSISQVQANNIPAEAPLFTRSPIAPSSSQPAPPTPVKAEQIQQPEYVLKQQSPTGAVPSSNFGQPIRQNSGFSLESRSVNYAPPETQHINQHQKQTMTQTTQHSVNVPNALPPQQAQQMPYAPPNVYSNYQPYLGMYSPMRSDDAGFAAATLMQFPFGVGQIDLTNLLPTQSSLSGGQAQPTHQAQHRNDNHQMMDLNKYTGMNTARENPVGPPPGFTNNGYMPPHQPQNMFLPTYQSAPYQYMVPPVNARPMYNASGDEDRKAGTYDRGNAGKGGAQHTPPPHFQQHGGNAYMSGLGKPKQSQPYGAPGHAWNT
ncbi:unnamed protein product, partial [Mesorhabditis spiculigera]